MKLLILSLVALLLPISPAGLLSSQKGTGKQVRKPKISLSQVTTAIRINFGSKIRVVADTSPFYLVGDFNGDGFKDIAVLVDPDGAQRELKNNGVKYVDIDPTDAN